MKYILDRFEEEFAALEKETGGTVNISKSFLQNAKEGDVIIEIDGKYLVDEKATNKRKTHLEEKIKRLFSEK